MLDLAGVSLRRFRIHTQADEEIGEGPVAIQHLLGDGQTRRLQGDKPRFIHGDVAVFPQTLGLVTPRCSATSMERIKPCCCCIMSIVSK